MHAVSKFLDFLDNRAVFRRLAFVVVLVGTVRITAWAIEFAQLWLASNKSGADVGIVIAAVTGPFTALQTMVIKFYNEDRANVSSGGGAGGN